MLNIKNSGKHAHTLSNKKNQSNTPFHSQIHPTNVNTWPTRLLCDHVTHSYYEWMDNWINECMTEKMMWWNIRKRNKNTTSCDNPHHSFWRTRILCNYCEWMLVTGAVVVVYSTDQINISILRQTGQKSEIVFMYILY